jgi:hypothetical protein
MPLACSRNSASTPTGTTASVVSTTTLNQKIKRLNIEIRKKGEAKAERGA